MALMVAVKQQVGSFSADEEPGAKPVVVALVSSAGGVQALRTILRQLPADFPAAVVALLHRKPDTADRLPAILARGCSLPVVAAEDDKELEAGTVVVVPPGAHALVTTGNHIVLIPTDGLSPYRPSADLLLASLAVAAGRRVIAVVLSGLGHDGATGAVAVHRFGGVVMASDETSSEFFAMPQAAIERDDAVDYVLPLTDIAPALLKFTNQIEAESEDAPGDLRDAV